MKIRVQGDAMALQLFNEAMRDGILINDPIHTGVMALWDLDKKEVTYRMLMVSDKNQFFLIDMCADMAKDFSIGLRRALQKGKEIETAQKKRTKPNKP